MKQQNIENKTHERKAQNNVEREQEEMAIVKQEKFSQKGKHREGKVHRMKKIGGERKDNQNKVEGGQKQMRIVEFVTMGYLFPTNIHGEKLFTKVKEVKEIPQKKQNEER